MTKHVKPEKIPKKIGIPMILNGIRKDKFSSNLSEFDIQKVPVKKKTNAKEVANKKKIDKISFFSISTFEFFIYKCNY